MQKAIEQNAQNDRLCLLINLTPHQPGWSRSSKCFNFFAAKITHVLKKRKGHIWRWSSCTWWCARLCGFLTKIDFWSQIQFCKLFWNCQFVVVHIIWENKVFGVLDCGKCTSSNRAGLGGNEDEQLAFAFFFTCDLGVVACCLCIIAPTIRP